MATPAEPTEGGEAPELAKELARVYRALQTLSAGSRTLLRASDEQDLLTEMWRVIVETGGYRMAGVAYAEHDEAKSIRWMAGNGIEMSLMETRNFTWADTEFGRTATANAIRTNHPVVGRHLHTDPAYDGPAYASVRETALQRGYAAVTAFPLRVESEVLGALIIGAAEANAFDEREVELLSKLADDLAYGVANLRIRALHRDAQATIARLAYFDPLTGLPNRTLLLEAIDRAITAVKQQHPAFALLYLEIGRFQEINKVLGYLAGDALLLQLSERLPDAVKAPEMLARVGDAEFAVLLPHADAKQAIAAAQRLLSCLRVPVEVAGLMLDARVGIGIALYPSHATDPNALI